MNAADDFINNTVYITKSARLLPGFLSRPVLKLLEAYFLSQHIMFDVEAVTQQRIDECRIAVDEGSTAPDHVSMRRMAYLFIFFVQQLSVICRTESNISWNSRSTSRHSNVSERRHGRLGRSYTNSWLSDSERSTRLQCEHPSQGSKAYHAFPR